MGAPAGTRPALTRGRRAGSSKREGNRKTPVVKSRKKQRLPRGTGGRKRHKKACAFVCLRLRRWSRRQAGGDQCDGHRTRLAEQAPGVSGAGRIRGEVEARSVAIGSPNTLRGVDQRGRAGCKTQRDFLRYGGRGFLPFGFFFCAGVTAIWDEREHSSSSRWSAYTTCPNFVESVTRAAPLVVGFSAVPALLMTATSSQLFKFIVGGIPP